MAISLGKRVREMLAAEEVQPDQTSRLLSHVARDQRITPYESDLLDKVAALPDERFAPTTGANWSETKEALRTAASNIRALRNAKLTVHETLPGLAIKLDRTIKSSKDEFGDDWYYRTLSVVIDGAPEESGKIKLSLGSAEIEVDIRKHTMPERILQKIAEKIAEHQGSDESGIWNNRLTILVHHA